MREANWKRGATAHVIQKFVDTELTEGWAKIHVAQTKPISIWYDAFEAKISKIPIFFCFLGSWRFSNFVETNGIWGGRWPLWKLRWRWNRRLLLHLVASVYRGIPSMHMSMRQLSELSAWPRYVQTTVREHEHAYCTGLLMLTGSLAAYWNRTFVVLQRLRGRCWAK